MALNVTRFKRSRVPRLAQPFRLILSAKFLRCRPPKASKQVLSGIVPTGRSSFLALMFASLLLVAFMTISSASPNVAVPVASQRMSTIPAMKNVHRPFGLLIPRTVAEEFVSVNLGSSDIVNGLRRPNPEPGDGETVAEAATVACVVVRLVDLRMNRGLDSTKGSSDRYIYFRVDDQFIFEDSHPTVDVSVRYLDHAEPGWAPTFCLQYRRSDGTTANVCQAVTDTACMKTRVFSLTDAFFGNGMPGQSDFRIWSGGQVGTASEDTRRFIDFVKVTKR